MAEVLVVRAAAELIDSGDQWQAGSSSHGQVLAYGEGQPMVLPGWGFR